jgi:hypothetical protein
MKLILSYLPTFYAGAFMGYLGIGVFDFRFWAFIVPMAFILELRSHVEK